MTQTATQIQPWSRSLSQPATEFGPTPLRLLSGAIPTGLRGTLYRNGTGRLQRGAESVGHWFDGDGAILRVNFTDAGASGTYRYVKTQGYLAEAEAGEYLYGNYGMRHPGPVWQHWLGLINHTAIKNSANTSVLALSDRLLALWEAGNPHALDLETLETIGKEDLGWLKDGQPFSAHPLRDPQSGEIYSIGVDSTFTLHLYRCDREGRLLKKTAIALKDNPLVHSFVLAGPYLVFLISPIKAELFPLLLNTKAYADALQWVPERGTRVIVVDRETLTTIAENETDPWFQWHFGNGCVEADGTIRCDLARFEDFTSTNEFLREVPTGKIETPSYSSLWQLRLDPQTGRVVSNEPVVERNCEFPVVSPADVGQPWHSTYFAMHRSGVQPSEVLFGAIGRFDYSTGELTQADLGENRYVSEPIYGADAEMRDRGWLLTVIYNSRADRSELWVFDTQHLSDQPVCQLALPGVVPPSFHGTWKPAKR